MIPYTITSENSKYFTKQIKHIEQEQYQKHKSPNCDKSPESILNPYKLTTKCMLAGIKSDIISTRNQTQQPPASNITKKMATFYNNL